MTPTVIALDVDGTLYHDSTVAADAVEVIARATGLGHMLVIVTGRRWDSLFDVIPMVMPFCTAAICENGGTLVHQHTLTTTLLARPTDASLVAALLAAGVTPLDVGTVALGAPSEHAVTAQRIIDELGGDEVIVHNKDSIMLLPPGCDKGVGLRAALASLTAQEWPVIAIGDAGNDLPMFAVATHPRGVANSDAAVVASGVPLTRASAGRGVAEALRQLLGL